MMTSWFFNPKLVEDEVIEYCVSIARWPPRNWRGLRDIALAPPVALMIRARAGEFRTARAFEREYRKLVLEPLDPHQIFDRHKGHILLCYERPGEPCHRRIVAGWLEKSLGITVDEYDY